MSKKRDRDSPSNGSVTDKKKVVTERKVVKASRAPKSKVPVLERAPTEGLERKRKTSPPRGEKDKSKTNRRKSRSRSKERPAHFTENMPVTYVRHPEEDKDDIDVTEKLRLLFLG